MADSTESREARLLRGLALYRDSDFARACEEWEGLWRDEMDPVHRELLQALLQMAAGIHRLATGGGATVAIHLLERAGVHLRGVPDEHAGIDVASLRRDAERSRVEIERRAALGETDFDPSVVPVIQHS